MENKIFFMKVFGFHHGNLKCKNKRLEFETGLGIMEIESARLKSFGTTYLNMQSIPVPIKNNFATSPGLSGTFRDSARNQNAAFFMTVACLVI